MWSGEQGRGPVGGVSGCGRQREMWMVRGDQPHICGLHHTMTKHVNISYKDWFCLTLSKIHPRISFPVKSFRVTQPYKSNGRFMCARFLLNVYRVTTLRKWRFLPHLSGSSYNRKFNRDRHETVGCPNHRTEYLTLWTIHNQWRGKIECESALNSSELEEKGLSRAIKHALRISFNLVLADQQLLFNRSIKVRTHRNRTRNSALFGRRTWLEVYFRLSAGYKQH